MSVEFDRGSPGKFDSRTLNRNALSRWTGRIHVADGSARGLGAKDCTPEVTKEKQQVIIKQQHIISKEMKTTKNELIVVIISS